MFILYMINYIKGLNILLFDSIKYSIKRFSLKVIGGTEGNE